MFSPLSTQALSLRIIESHTVHSIHFFQWDCIGICLRSARVIRTACSTRQPSTWRAYLVRERLSDCYGLWRVSIQFSIIRCKKTRTPSALKHMLPVFSEKVQIFGGWRPLQVVCSYCFIFLFPLQFLEVQRVCEALNLTLFGIPDRKIIHSKLRAALGPENLDGEPISRFFENFLLFMRHLLIRNALVIFAEVVKALLEADDFNVHFRKNPHANLECDNFL